MNDADLLSKLQRLRTTEDHSERNALALELSDTRDARVFPALIDLIQEPRLENHRGTLVYCLENYDCIGVADLLIHLSTVGNLEVRMQADAILDAQSLRAGGT